MKKQIAKAGSQWAVSMYFSMIVGLWVAPYVWAYKLVKSLVKREIVRNNERKEMYDGNYSQTWFAGN